MAFRDSLRQTHSAGRIFIALAMTLLLTAVAAANVLRVPEDFAAIQPAMDASSVGDTVVVARGTWVGLLESPTHSLTLCSEFLFSQDSTDVLETVLDAEFQGTLITVNTRGLEVLRIFGLTLEHGQGRRISNVINCVYGGAIHVVDDGNLTVQSSIVANNRAPDGASALFFGMQCGLCSEGSLVLQHVHFVGNYNEQDEDRIEAVLVDTWFNDRVVIEDITYDGSGISRSPISVTTHLADSTSIRNIHSWNCNGGMLVISISGNQSIEVEGIRTTTTSDTLLGSRLGFGFLGIDELIHVQLLDIEEAGNRNERGGSIGGDNIIMDVENASIHDNRYFTEGFRFTVHGDTASGTLRNLELYNNVVGDSTGDIATRVMKVDDMDVSGAHIYSNHVIIPTTESPVGETGGRSMWGCVLYAHSRYIADRRFENILCEDNFVDDLDDYSNLHPEMAPRQNDGRDLCFWGVTTIEADNITIRNSRQPNHTPELYAPGYMTLSTSGSCLYLYAPTKTVTNVTIEDCDDGGVLLSGGLGDNLIQNAVIRNVGRSAVKTGSITTLRNVLVDNVDAVDNYLYLTPGYVDDTEQSVVYNRGGAGGQVVLENVTITNCDDMRRPFGFNPYVPVGLTASNTILSGNTFDMLIENNAGESWSHCYVQEAVEGEGNIIGNDPLFDPERGIPFLAPDSPCIDAGNPDAAYNDIEDPDAPGFALWPSQGSLRNDIGCTGGPFANDSMFVSVAPSTPITLPTSPTLGDAYPNPFNPTTTIPFVIQQPTHLRLTVYNLRGQQIATLADDAFPPGEHRVTFDGSSLASGVYLVHLNGEDVSQTSKVLLLK